MDLYLIISSITVHRVTSPKLLIMVKMTVGTISGHLIFIGEYTLRISVLTHAYFIIPVSQISNALYRTLNLIICVA